MSDSEQGATPVGSRLTDPAPVIAVGVAAWVIALVVILVSGDRWNYALPTCWAGLIMGIIGFTLFLVQRRAARSGSKTAQRGLT